MIDCVKIEATNNLIERNVWIPVVTSSKSDVAKILFEENNEEIFRKLISCFPKEYHIWDQIPDARSYYGWRLKLSHRQRMEEKQMKEYITKQLGAVSENWDKIK